MLVFPKSGHILSSSFTTINKGKSLSGLHKVEELWILLSYTCSLPAAANLLSQYVHVVTPSCLLMYPVMLLKDYK